VSGSATKAVFLDRDGVLNEAIVRDGRPFSPASLQEVVIVPGARALMDVLRRAGFRLIVVTNQPDVARGKITREAAEAVNRYVCKMAAVDAAELCAHDDADACDCRKPKPGMLLRAAQREGISLEHSFMVGDRWRDVEAGRRAGCRTVLIGDGYREAADVRADATVGDLRAAVDWMLAQSGRAQGDA